MSAAAVQKKLYAQPWATRLTTPSQNECAAAGNGRTEPPCSAEDRRDLSRGASQAEAPFRQPEHAGGQEIHQDDSDHAFQPREAGECHERADALIHVAEGSAQGIEGIFRPGGDRRVHERPAGRQRRRQQSHDQAQAERND